MRRFISGLLVASLLVAPLAADEGKSQSAVGTSSGGKRAMWIVIGAAAGFGAGMLIGLNAFDDAIDSDRKVWTTALVSAAAGGVAGGLLSRSVGPSTATRHSGAVKAPVPDVSWKAALNGGAVQPPPRRAAPPSDR